MTSRLLRLLWLCSFASCCLAAGLEEPSELGWLWASSVALIYFSLVIGLRWWRGRI
jgi:hypothetical protein